MQIYFSSPPKLPKNLIELLAFVPPTKSVQQDTEGHWICQLTTPLKDEDLDQYKLRFGYRTGLVTNQAIKIERWSLMK